MTHIIGWRRLAVLAGLLLATAACSSYPAEPRYSTRPMPLPGTTGAPPTSEVIAPTPAPPVAAPYESIEGGALDTPADGRPGRDAPPPPGSAAAGAHGAAPSSSSTATLAYEIQQGDTISGVGRRFQTPVQTLIELNRLDARGDIRVGQRIVLPHGAVDRGPDPFATGPSPVGVAVTNDGVPPPPPPPSSAPSRSEPAPPAAVSSVSLDWPVRGDILRRFGPGPMGVRNNGINIGAPQGQDVRASAAGRVGYVGDDLAGQGLTVLIVHRDGWRTVYSHLGSASVRDGQDITAGQVIGTVGTTAGDGRASIHFETWRMRGDEPVALDPLTVLPR